MKHSHDAFDPAARTIPGGWLRGSPPGSRDRTPYKWITTLPAALADVRDCTLQALSGIDARLAYLYENEEKVVIRCTLPQRQIRAELKRLDPRATRIVVVTMRGSEVDRHTSGALVDAIEHALEDSGSVLDAGAQLAR